MLPDLVRSQIAKLLGSIATRGTAVAICDAQRQIEVEIGDVSAFLGLVGEARGTFMQEQEGRHVVVSERVGGYSLVASADEDGLGDAIASLWAIGPELDSLLSPDGPEPGPAAAQALKAG